MYIITARRVRRNSLLIGFPHTLITAHKPIIRLPACNELMVQAAPHIRCLILYLPTKSVHTEKSNTGLCATAPDLATSPSIRLVLNSQSVYPFWRYLLLANPSTNMNQVSRCKCNFHKYYIYVTKTFGHNRYLATLTTKRDELQFHTQAPTTYKLHVLHSNEC